VKFTNAGVDGADCSFYQDNNGTPQQIDFSKMVGQGADFVIVRAGQNLWPDPDFNYNWKNAKIVGLPRGSYWFYDSRVSPEKQAEIFASMFKADMPELELWLDIEEHYGGPYAGYKNWKKFLDKLIQLLPQARIGIYTSYGYIAGVIPAAEFPYFAKFPLWLASWNPVDKVDVPLPWLSCLYWQWGTPTWGIAWGCESFEIDMNLFNGTKEEFLKLYNLTDQTETIPPGDDDMAITPEQWNQLIEKLDDIKKAILATPGGGTVPPSTAIESVYKVIEKDANMNRLVVFYKTPDINDTTVDRIPVPPEQTVHVINDWKNVPAGLVGWKAMDDIEKQNTYQNWICVHETQVKTASGKWRAFPEIYLAGGTTRAEYCWMLRSCLGAKVA